MHVSQFGKGLLLSFYCPRYELQPTATANMESDFDLHGFLGYGQFFGNIVLDGDERRRTNRP